MQHATFDGWTFVHALSGVTLAALKVNRATAYSLIIWMEIIEFAFQQPEPGSFFSKETTKNIIADLAVGIASYESFR